MKTFKYAVLFILSLTMTKTVSSQQLTTTNAAGNTIVEQVATNAFGQTVTQTLQTLAAGAATATTSAATSPAAASTSPATSATTTTKAGVVAPVQQGPVGQPGSTPVSPGGPTPFTYTTTDANGNAVIFTSTFTPTFPATTPYTPTGTGTILGYSQWLSMVGGTVQPGATVAVAANPASRPGVSLSLLLGALSIVIVGLVGGSIAILL